MTLRALAAFLLALLVAACTPDMEGQVEIHYFEFGFEPFRPITPDNIAEEHSRYGKVEVADPRLQEVMKLLDGAGSGSFYEGATRARIRDSSGTTIYIDNYCGIQRSILESELTDANLARVVELLWLMTAPRQSSGLPLWAEEATHAYIAQSRGWQRADYTLMMSKPESDAQAGLVIVEVEKVSYRDRFTPSFSAYQRVMAAHSQIFELHFDPETKELVREIRHQ